MKLDTAKLVFVDVETTGFSPARGDRIVEVACITCQGSREQGRFTQMVNPDRPIPERARRIHGIGDEDVAASPGFATVSGDICGMLQGAVVVGHCVRFDAGFLAMEIANTPFFYNSVFESPLACLDTCQLAAALWDLPNFRLDTVAGKLGIKPGGAHRAERDADVCRMVFDRMIRELGGWWRVTLAELTSLHAYPVTWPADPRETLPPPVYDALTSGGEVTIRYVNGDSVPSRRTIRPVACFPAGRFTYVRAWCSKANELRTFRLDRMRMVSR